METLCTILPKCIQMTRHQLHLCTLFQELFKAPYKIETVCKCKVVLVQNIHFPHQLPWSLTYFLLLVKYFMVSDHSEWFWSEKSTSVFVTFGWRIFWLNPDWNLQNLFLWGIRKDFCEAIQRWYMHVLWNGKSFSFWPNYIWV